MNINELDLSQVQDFADLETGKVLVMDRDRNLYRLTPSLAHRGEYQLQPLQIKLPEATSEAEVPAASSESLPPEAAVPSKPKRKKAG